MAVVEHRSILARVRGEWARLRRKGLAIVWSPASQDTSHVGHAGVGVVSFRSAPLSLPTFATAQFKRFFDCCRAVRCILALPTLATAQFRRFFDCGRAVRCLLPLGFGKFLHLVVQYGYQGADREAEKLALTDELLDAAFGELGVVAREQPCLVVGDFNVEPTKILCLAKGISAGLWVDLEAAWAFASCWQPGETCQRSWDSAGGSRMDFMIGCPRAAAAVSGCMVREDRWILPHLAVRTHFQYSRWVSGVSQLVQRTPL